MHQLPAAWTLHSTMCLHSTMPTIPETSSHPAPPLQLSASAAIGTAPSSTVVSHVALTGSKSRQVLLMTCHVSVLTPDGHTIQVRALLDSASSSSFVLERLAQYLHLPRSRRLAQIAGIGGVSNQSLEPVSCAPWRCPCVVSWQSSRG